MLHQMISNILKDGPSERRKFLDMMIGQLKLIFIQFINIIKLLEQRNSF